MKYYIFTCFILINLEYKDLDFKNDKICKTIYEEVYSTYMLQKIIIIKMNQGKFDMFYASKANIVGIQI